MLRANLWTMTTTTTRALRRSTRLAFTMLTIAASSQTLAGSMPAMSFEGMNSEELRIELVGLRSMKGAIVGCIALTAEAFPDCKARSGARSFRRKAATSIAISGLRPGTYAIALFHDENGNGRLDKFIGIPREGYGFSGSRKGLLGVPSFRSAVIDTSDGGSTIVRIRYLS